MALKMRKFYKHAVINTDMLTRLLFSLFLQLNTDGHCSQAADSNNLVLPFCQLSTCSTVFLDKPTVHQLVKKIPHTLGNPNVHYFIHKHLPLVPILGQINPVHASPSFLYIHFNIILPPMPRACQWSLSHQNSVCTSPVPLT